jgi:hypothetical protein
MFLTYDMSNTVNKFIEYTERVSVTYYRNQTRMVPVGDDFESVTLAYAQVNGFSTPEELKQTLNRLHRLIIEEIAESLTKCSTKPMQKHYLTSIVDAVKEVNKNIVKNSDGTLHLRYSSFVYDEIEPVFDESYGQENVQEFLEVIDTCVTKLIGFLDSLISDLESSDFSMKVLDNSTVSEKNNDQRIVLSLTVAQIAVLANLITQGGWAEAWPKIEAAEFICKHFKTRKGEMDSPEYLRQKISSPTIKAVEGWRKVFNECKTIIDKQLAHLDILEKRAGIK